MILSDELSSTESFVLRPIGLMRNSVLEELRGRFADKLRSDLRLQGQGKMKDGGEGKSLNGFYTSKGRGKERIGIGEGWSGGRGMLLQGLRG